MYSPKYNKTKMTILGSRTHYCINSNAKKWKGGVNDGCNAIMLLRKCEVWHVCVKRQALALLAFGCCKGKIKMKVYIINTFDDPYTNAFHFLSSKCKY